MTLSEIVADVSKKMGVPVEDIMSASRKKRVSIARWECWRRLAEIGWSSTRIGEYWKRDHSTVVHGVQRIGGKFNRHRKLPKPKSEPDEVRRAMMIRAYWAERGVSIKTRFEAQEHNDRTFPALRSNGIPVRG